jgi:membrane protein implicated in regulation of membrane protease activity
VEHTRADRFEVIFRVVHFVAAVFALLLYVLARGSVLEFLGGAIIAVVSVSLAVHFRRRPQYRVLKARLRTRRLKRKRVAVLAPAGNPLSGQTVRILGTVRWVAETRTDEIIVRTDAAVKTTGNARSNLLALAPVQPGDMFTTLLDVGRMNVGVWLLDSRFLSVRRINFRARRRLQPSLSLGNGVVLLMNSPPLRARSKARVGP